MIIKFYASKLYYTDFKQEPYDSFEEFNIVLGKQDEKSKKTSKERGWLKTR